MEVSKIVGFAHHSYIWRMSFASALKRLSGNRLDSFPFTVFRDEISCRGIWDFFTRLCYFFRRKLVIWKAWIFFGRTRLISKHRWCSGFWANPFVLLSFFCKRIYRLLWCAFISSKGFWDEGLDYNIQNIIFQLSLSDIYFLFRDLNSLPSLELS